MVSSSTSGADGFDGPQLTRKRLDQLDYKNYELNSLELENRLISDLISATDAAKGFKSQLLKQQTETQNVQSMIDPLREQLSKLTSENNKLHLDYIQLQSQSNAREKRAQQITKQQQKRNDDLAFVNSQLVQTINEQRNQFEIDLKRMEEQLQRHGIISSRSSAKPPPPIEKIFNKLQKIDIETNLEPLESPFRFQTIEPQHVDLVSIADKNVEMMNSRVQDLEAQNGDLESQIGLVQDQVMKRDQEIQRLGVQLEIARAQQWGGSEPMNNVTDIGVAKRRIDQLEMQIEHLGEHIESLEKEREGFESEKKLVYDTCIDERQDLVRELEDVKTKNTALLKNMSKMESMIDDLDAMKSKKAKYSTNNNNNDDDDDDNDKNTVKTLNNAPIARNIKRIAELEDKVKSLQEKLRKSTQQLTDSKQNIDVLTRENEDLKKKKTVGGKKKSLVLTNSVQTQSSTDQKNFIEIKSYKQLESKYEKIEKEKRTLEVQLTTLNRQLEDIKNDTREVKSVASRLEYSQKVNAQLKTDLDNAEKNLEIVETDRTKLLEALENVETFLNQVNEKVASVTAERDNLQVLYTQVNTQFESLRRSRPVQTSSGAVVEPVKVRLAQVQTDAYTPENGIKYDSLLKDYETLKKNHNIVKDELEKCKSDLEATVFRQAETGSSAIEALRQLEAERDGLKAAIDARDRDKQLVQDNVVALEKHLLRLKDDLEECERKEESLKTKLRNVEMEKDKETFNYRQSKSHLSEANSTIDRLKAEVSRLKSDNDNLESNVKKTRELLDTVDRERDMGQIAMDEKDVEIAHLLDKASGLESRLKEMESENFHVREQFETLNSHTNDLDMQNANLQTHLQRTINERDSFSDTIGKLENEVRNVGADLEAVSSENQLLHSRLTQAVNEKDQRLAELQQCERYIQKLEDSISIKDSERENLMSAYRKLIADHEKLELNCKVTGEDSNHLKMEVIMRDKRIETLSKEKEDLKVELNKFKIDLNAYEKQCNALSRNLASADRALSIAEKEKLRMSKEVDNTQNIALSIEKTREEARSQILSLTVENERLVNESNTLNSKISSLKNETQVLNTKIEGLEKNLNLERMKRMQPVQPTNTSDDDDLMFAKRQYESQIQQVKSQHSNVLAQLTLQLDQVQVENTGLKAHLEYIEKENKKVFDGFKGMFSQVRIQVDDLKKEMYDGGGVQTTPSLIDNTGTETGGGGGGNNNNNIKDIEENLKKIGDALRLKTAAIGGSKSSNSPKSSDVEGGDDKGGDNTNITTTTTGGGGGGGALENKEGDTLANVLSLM